MPRFAGMSCEISGAVIAPTIRSSQDNAWSGRYCTIRLQSSLSAIRLSASREKLREGVWFGIGDVIMTVSEYRNSRALSIRHVFVAECVLPAGCVLNVGVAGAQHNGMFDGSGGGDQAEYLPGHGGSSPSIEILDAFWSDNMGHA